MMQALEATAPYAAHENPTSSSAAASSRQPRTLRIAYLLSRYPAVSHTFFLQEVLGLRARGIHIETISINRPDRPLADLPPIEAKEAASTFYVKDGNWIASLLLLLETCIMHPVVLSRGLGCVLSIRGITLRQRGQWLFYLAEALLVGRWIREKKLTHLHVHFGGPVASVGMLVSHAWKIAYSLTIHGPEELLNTDSGQLRAKLRQAAFVICISDFCRSQLCMLTSPNVWSKLFVVRLGVDPVVLTPVSRSMQPKAIAASQTLHLVCTGRLVAEKGHRILLQALELLWERGINLHATLIGSGPERHSLAAFVKRHQREQRVTFTSALSHVETLEHVRRADIFALASFAEGIPVALMEAMALGVPCVSTTVAGIPELIRNGEDGLLVPPSNVEVLADALEKLVRDATLRKSLAASARQRIIGHYNLPLNLERLAQCLQEQTAVQQHTGVKH